MIICKHSSPCSFQAKTSRELTSAFSPLLSSTENTQRTLLHKYQSDSLTGRQLCAQHNEEKNPYWKKWQSSNCLGNRQAQNQPQALPRFAVAVILFPVGFRGSCLLTFLQQICRAGVAASRDTHTAPHGTTAAALRLFCSKPTAFFLTVSHCSSHTPGFQVLRTTPAQHSCSLWSLNPFS